MNFSEILLLSRSSHWSRGQGSSIQQKIQSKTTQRDKADVLQSVTFFYVPMSKFRLASELAVSREKQANYKPRDFIRDAVKSWAEDLKSVSQFLCS